MDDSTFTGHGDPVDDQTRLAQGVDKTLQTETAFSGGFMLDPLDASGRKKR